MTLISHQNVISKSVGLVKLRDLMEEPRWWSVADIEEKLGISKRTAQRWIYDLEEIGCPIETGWEKGVRWRYRKFRGERGNQP